ncbi:hypothetical protein B9G69_006950 [Bdellovibrio sp. SKB1291214]|nr:hypothetical protein [Bdellovibrio sp. SKB1291214]UYL10316.1 hypothetical protein B9G69_006950 [Bdellovibrio sp. SKB1291214]
MDTLNTSKRSLLQKKMELGRKVLWFYAITFVSVEIIRHISNQ